MKDADRDLQRVLQIRQLRVDQLKRKQARVASEVMAAASQIQQAQRHSEELEKTLFQAEQESLRELLGASSVRVGELRQFTKRQSDAVDQINLSRKRIESSYLDHKDALDKLADSQKVTAVAEKKLIGLEEVIEGRLWK